MENDKKLVRSKKNMGLWDAWWKMITSKGYVYRNV